jgi:1,2-diacylglycerol 3-alpha-glucosyltransferase
MVETVTVFTDLYRPTINGVTYAIDLWRDRWRARGRMPVVFPRIDGYDSGPDEFPVRSLQAPLYEQYRLGLPPIPKGLPEPDLVHAHTPFSLGVAGLRYARGKEVPLVASYHTMLGERTETKVAGEALATGLWFACRRYERWFFEKADLVVTPTSYTRDYLREEVGIESQIAVLSNGVDTDLFSPTDSSGFRGRHGLADAGTLVGYTGRHSAEKRLGELIDAAAGTDLTLVLGGDGPERDALERHARESDVDARFLGFLDREELPAFYSALDVFAFPSPTETQGLVAMEAAACGTPTVAVDAGALSDTVIEGETGLHYPSGDVEAFRRAIERVLRDRDRLSDLCLRRREMLSVEHSIERLAALYESVVAEGRPAVSG